MSRPGRVALVSALLLAAGASGCIHHDLERNAPGLIDVRPPPARPASRAVETPQDPGEQLLVINVGPQLGGGIVKKKGDAEGEWTGTVSAEASMHYGTSPKSHAEDALFVYPAGSVGLNLGISALTRSGPTEGMVYLEGQYASAALGAAGGWAVDPWNKSHGPQGTLFFGPLYGRISYLLADRSEVTFGLLVKFSEVLVWSQ